MKQQKLNAEEIKAINNYSSEIKTLKDYVSGVRKMPGMYCGGKGNRGYLSLIREIYQNAIDQILMPNTPANYVYLYYNENTLECKVYDNGLGLPFQDMQRIITTPNTSKNYVKKKGSYSSGLHGSGLKITNALSSRLIAESYRYDGTAMRFTTTGGYPDSKGKNPKPIKNLKKLQGTHIEFIPDESVLGDIDLEWIEVYKLAKQILYRTPLGSIVDFEAVDKSGAVHKEHIVNQDGIVGDLIEHSKNPICKPISVFEDNGEMKLEAAFIFDGGGKEGPNSNELVTAFCNFCPCPVGTHVNGTITGITKWFVKYMNNIYLNTGNKDKKKKTTVIASDIKTGLVISINAAMLEPVFIGQAKEQLANVEMEGFCVNTVQNGLDKWSKENPQDLLKLCKYFKEIADLRIKESGEKVKIVNKYQANVLTGYPRKYAKPIKENKEFIIVEGDSAAGTVKVGRDINCQGIFPIRGKLPNAFRTSPKEFLNNAEIQGICKIVLGTEYHKNYDPNKVQWEKIIFMADGDVDGAHIDALLLRFFIMYFPTLIQMGKVYKAVPPLYSIPKKKGSGEEYFVGQYDFVKYIQKLFVKTNKITDLKNKPIPNKEMTVFFMRNQDYNYYLEKLSKTYAVDPRLMELALMSYHNKVGIKALKKSVKSQYRFMEVNKVKDTYVFEGIIKEANTLFMNERLIKDCKPILDILDKNNCFTYKMNGKVSTIYDIMKAFEALQPSHLQRYKGLGEMDADQLAESTLYGTDFIFKDEHGKKKNMVGNRTLIRYTLEDAKEEIGIIRQYESDFSQLFKFVGNVSRQDLLD